MTGRLALSAVLIALWLAATAAAEPAPPALAPKVQLLDVGVFCALQPMGQAPAPGTLSGWIHVPEEDVTFHWPDRQLVPAAIGLAFGTRVQLAAGHSIPYGELRIYRPGSDQPEIWGASFSDLGATLSFFRFDREDELIPGLWRLEAWDGEDRLFSIEFDVVPAASLPEIAKACGALS